MTGRSVSIALAVLLLGPLAGRGRADEAAVTRVSLAIHNDSTSSSLNGVGLLWGAQNLDGNDLGFTHGMTLTIERRDAGGLTRTATVSSKLYLRQIGEASLLDESDPVPVWVTEEDVVSLALDNRRRRLPSYYRLAAGFLSANKGANPLGSLRQQLEFHSIFHTSDLATYDYFHDGWNALGFFVHAAGGLQGSWEIGGAFRASAAAELALEPNTLYEASQAIQRLDAALSRPFGKVLLEAAVGADTALHPGGVEFLPRIALTGSLGRWSLTSSVSYPQGELRNHMRYNDDKDAVATLTLTLTL